MARIALLALALSALAPPALAQQAEATPQQLDPNGTRLFLSPTARALPQGQGRFSDYFIFFPSVAYGFTDWLDAAAGVSLLPGSRTQLVTVNVKAQVVDGESTDIAVGNLFAVPVGEVSGGFGGTAYGLATFGSARQSITVGTYVAYAGFNESRTTCDEDDCTTENAFGIDVADGVVLVVGGEVQVSGSVKLISENYLGLAEGAAGGIVSGGVRFFGEQLAVDFALFRPIGEGSEFDGFPFVPYVGFSYNFGR